MRSTVRPPIRPLAAARRRTLPLAAGPAALVLLAGAIATGDATAASRRAERALAHEGMSCTEVESAAVEGSTHECLFVPAMVKRRDFSRPNVRASHVVTVLGPDCGFVEILSDEAFTDESGRELRRVGVACTD